jgi:predicted RNA binding protein YcfA (HicA-like mRNA interferase family)
VFRLRSLHWKQLEKAILHFGCEFIGQESDHRKYWRKGFTRPIILPTYKDVPKFIISQIIRQLGVTKDDFYRHID